jgi:di/tricarboxylate transporter
MNKKDDNPIARLEPRKRNYPLVICAVVLFGVLVAGAVVSAKASNLGDAMIFIGALALFVVVMLLDISKTRRMAAIDDRRFIRWDTAMPEIQRQTVNVEVRELARLLDVGVDQLPDLLSAYIVAEDLALRQIQQEENLPLMRHVSIGSTPFDAILIDQDLITCIEVAFLVVPDVRQDRIESVLKKITQAKKNLAEMKSRLRLRLMLVLVTQLTSDEEEQLRGMLITRRFTDTPVDIDIRLLDFEMLQKVYVSE